MLFNYSRSGRRRTHDHRYAAKQYAYKLLASALILLCSCQEQSIGEIFRGNAMTMDYQVTIGKSLSESERNQVENIITATFLEVDSIYNKWNPLSELSFVNRQSGDIPISEKLEKLLLLTDHVVHLSEGRFDPTIEPVQKLWKSHFAAGTWPSEAEISELRGITGWDKIQLGPGTIRKEVDEVELDLGGIAKGYAVDLLVENLNAAGFSNVFVEWGGEIRASGRHPEGRPWRIFIRNLKNTEAESAIAQLDLKDQSIATSGDYLQYWETEKGTFFHIIDPRTLHPLEVRADSIASASVIAKKCALADGLATAAMLFSSVDESKAWAEKLNDPELSFWIISQNTH